jgi:hypothetical protein
MPTGQAQDRGYQAPGTPTGYAEGTAGFGYDVPSPGDFTDQGKSAAWKFANELELAEAEAADRGRFDKADEHMATADNLFLHLTSDWTSSGSSWRKSAADFIDSLRPHEQALLEKAATDDAETVDHSEKVTEQDTPQQAQENVQIEHLMEEKAAGVSNDQISAEYAGLPPAAAKAYGVATGSVESAKKFVSENRGKLVIGGIVVAALLVLAVLARGRVL